MNNIVLCGFMGCGKSTIGKALAERLGMDFIDTDDYIEDIHHTKIAAVFASQGESTFRDMEHDACKQLSAKENTVIATGGGALTFERNAKLFENDTVVFLDCPFEVIKQRIGTDPSRPLMKDDAEMLYRKRYDIYKSVCDIIINSNRDIDTVCDILIQKRRLI